jgi:hypothetical protein
VHPGRAGGTSVRSEPIDVTMAFLLKLVGLYLVAGALYYGYWVVVCRRWVEIIPGWCFQSGAMRPAQLVRYCRRYRISTVFDFRGARDAGVAEEQSELTDAGLRHVHIPCGREPTAEALQAFLNAADVERADGRRILLHCKDGQGRAIYFAAVSLMEYSGFTGSAAYLAVRRIPPSLRWIRWVIPRAGLLGRRNPKYRLILDHQARPTRRTLESE